MLKGAAAVIAAPSLAMAQGSARAALQAQCGCLHPRPRLQHRLQTAYRRLLTGTLNGAPLFYNVRKG
ncbi:hypothetical protein [Siccirubricoccus phaeus]|uniref:hypothetical protein n=1 Tax=Siccirubricoccus phaeus TaxID=2595053 RepID=UPI001F291E9A